MILFFVFIHELVLCGSQNQLQNHKLTITFNETNGRIDSIQSSVYNQQFAIVDGDDFNITLNISNRIYVLSPLNVSQEWSIDFLYYNQSLIQTVYESNVDGLQFKVTMQYKLEKNWNFASKSLMIHLPAQCNQFQVISVVNIFHELKDIKDSNVEIGSYHVAIDHMLGGKQIAIFTRFTNNYGFFQLISNPFTKYNFNVTINDQIAMYSPYEDFQYKQINNLPYYATDNILFGIYKLTKYQIVTNAEYIRNQDYPQKVIWSHPSLKGEILSTNINPVSINAEYSSSTYTNLAERDLISSIQEMFLMDMEMREKYGSIRINVGWDENDYQLNFGTNTTDIETYNRIFIRNNQYNIKHETMAAYNPLQGTHDRAFLGWEPVLWFSEGENIRELMWNPLLNDTVPPEIQNIVSNAKKYDIKLNPYIYPILPLLNPFNETTDWLFISNNKSYASLAHVDYQNYLMQLLPSFCNITNCGGFNWDMVYFMDPNCVNEYTQYKGWMRVIEHLRNVMPDIVMDHRQMNRDYGIWYQLAGSYAEPLARDENPETYGIYIPNLHTDHNAADYMRRQTWIYYQSQYQSVYRIPGFIHHQTDRNLANGTLVWDPMYMRDFDILGSIFSMIANVGYASQNMVFAMLPARDMEEFEKMPKEQIDFVNYWLNFTNIYIDYLKYTKPILSMPTSTPISVDGTSSINSFIPYNDTGFIFLYNSYYTALNATITFDESISISNNSMGDTFIVSMIYPINTGDAIVKLGWGQEYTFVVNGTAAYIFKVEKENIKITPKIIPYPMIVPARPNGPKPVEMDDNFTYGYFNGSFIIPSQAYNYLSDVNKSYPMNWNEDNDYNITWLIPSRLLMYISILQPLNDTLMLSNDLKLMIDKKVIDSTLIKKAYNSRHETFKCFNGFYFIVEPEMVKPDITHTVALYIPSTWNLKPGQFQGIFWENLNPSFFV